MSNINSKSQNLDEVLRDSIINSHSNSFLMISFSFWCPYRHSYPYSRLRTKHNSAFKWNADCFSCLFTTHGSVAFNNLLFLPRTICGISWIKMILIILLGKDPWQLWIPLKLDQKPLVPHLYHQSNSIGLAWVTPEVGCLDSFVIASLIYSLIFPILYFNGVIL